MASTYPRLPPLTVDVLGDGRRVAATLLELMPGVGLVIVDEQCRICLMDGDLFARHGIDPPAAVGRHLSEVLPSSAWAAVEGLWSAALLGEAQTLDRSSLDGSEDHLLHFAPLRAPDDTIIGAAMTAQDVTERSRAYRRLERRVRQQEAIAALGTIALRGMPAAELMQEASRVVQESLGADAAGVFPYASTGGLEVRGLAGEVDLPMPSANVSPGPDLILDHMRDADAPLLIDDLRVSAWRAPILEAEGMVSMMVAPIGEPANRYGMLGACCRASGSFSQEDLAFIQATANLLAEAVERERVADEARDREARLNEAQRLAGAGSWEMDPRAGLILSAHLREMLHLEPSDDATDLETVVTHVHDEDRSRVRRHIEDPSATGHATPVEFRVVAGDGAVRLLRARAMGRPEGLEPGETLRGTVQDVTEARRAEQALRRSEERFREGFDTSPIGMALVGATSRRFIRVNVAYSRLVGRSAEELLTMTLADVMHPEDLALPSRAAFDTGLAKEMVIESRYVRPDGSVVWGSINASRLVDAEGGEDIRFVQVQDVTERRAREEATRRELEAVAWVREIHAALAEDRFELHAQPIVHLGTGEIVQRELLLRMRSPEGELIGPGRFLPTAEHYGVIRDIDRWVIARASELAARGMSVEINLSGTSMCDSGLIEEIDRANERTGADPSRLVFEITETAAIANVGVARRLATALRERGCRFALDDFGTGFAGISSLKALPLDYVKIDREFVCDVCTNETDRRVIAATIDLAHAFGLQTIAEGVEDQATLDLLRELGVDLAQGFFLGRPVPISA